MIVKTILQREPGNQTDRGDQSRALNWPQLGRIIMCVLCLAGIALQAQTPPVGPTPTPAPDARRQELLRQALRRQMAAGTNAVSPSMPAAPGAAPMTPAPGAEVPVIPPGPAAPVPQTTTPAADQIIAPVHPYTNTAPEETMPAGMIDFRQADINQVLQLYAELVNRTILRPATLPAGTITLKSQTALTKSEAIQALGACLAINGIAIIDFGEKFVKVVPQPTANNEGAPWNNLPHEKLPDFGQYMTRVVQLKYTKPSELVQVLQPFAKLPNAIMPVDSSQILVLRDNTENIKRMLEMIQSIDINIPAEYTNEVIMIKYALASDIASALNSLSSGGGGATVGSGSRASSGGLRSAGFGRGTSGIGGVGGVGGYPGSTTMPGINPQATTTPGAPAGGSSFTDRLRNIINKASVSGEIQIIGQTKIIADERTNSLLVFASRADMETIKKIISQLDVVLSQVLIEAVIIQVSLGNSKSLGISYLERQPHGIGNYFAGQGAVNNNTLFTGSVFNNVVNGFTNTGNSLPGGFSYLASFGNDLDVAVNALASDNKAKILQRPRVQTSNAKQATLFVGESRPYPTGSYYGGGAYGGYSSIQQMQIGVTLEVTPLINVDGLVVMDIHAKIDSVSGTVNIANVGDVPITSSKEAQASVAVRDHDTIMLGGLIETDKSQNSSGVPYLKDIPLMGALFRSHSSSDTRNELILLIRPTVLPTPEVAALAARAVKDSMPAVRRSEQEMLNEESRRMKQSDKEFNSQEMSR